MPMRLWPNMSHGDRAASHICQEEMLVRAVQSETILPLCNSHVPLRQARVAGPEAEVALH